MPAPELFQIPPDWQVARLEDVALSHKGAIKIGPFGSQLKKSDMTSSGFKVYGQENVFSDDFTLGDRFITRDKFESLQTCELFEGDIVLTMMGTVGAASIVPKGIHRGVMDSHLLRIRPNGRKIVDGFLRILLRDSPVTKRQVERMSQGGIMSGLNAGIVRTLELPLPPLPEQKKIAAILSSVDEAIQATQLVIDQTRRVKEGLLQDLLTHGLPGHTRFKQTEIGEIPESWEVRRLGDIASVERGKFSHRPRNAPHLYGGRHPFVQTGDIGAADDLLVSHSQTLNDEGLTYSRTFPAGTILITIAANIGDVALTTYPVSCPDSLVGIIPHSDDALWLLYTLAARKDRLDRHAPESAQKNINLQTLVPLPIAVPPRREQEGIRDAIQAVADGIRVEEERLRVLSRLKAGLLQDLLTGKVRVSA